MIRSLWFLFKLGAIIAGCLWIAERPGHITLSWLDITVTLQMGFFLLLCVAALIAAMVLFSVIKAILNTPKTLQKINTKNREHKGYKALTKGLTAVAAGDARAAEKLAARAQKFLPDDQGLPLLLEAQAARMNERDDDARRAFQVLMDNKDTAFLGIRGLLLDALEHSNHEQALALTARAKKIDPHKDWVLQTTYDLQLRQRDWVSALDTLKVIGSKKAQKQDTLADLFTPEKIKSDKIALYHALADQDIADGIPQRAAHKREKAYRFDPSFIPSVTRLAHSYYEDGRTRKAKNLIQKTWKAQPHPDLIPVWHALHNGDNTKDPMAKLKATEKLAALNPDHPLSQAALAQTALEFGLWGEARGAIEKAIDLSPSRDIYTLYALLEKKSGGTDEQILAMDNKAALADSDPVWTCAQTGRIYEEWSPLAQPQGLFNTIIWDTPSTISKAPLVLDHGNQTILDAPQLANIKTG